MHAAGSRTRQQRHRHLTVTYGPILHRCCRPAASPDEVDDFVKLLDSRDLAAAADEQLLVHLLLRADSINRRTADWRRLKVRAAALRSLMACLQHARNTDTACMRMHAHCIHAASTLHLRAG